MKFSRRDFCASAGSSLAAFAAGNACKSLTDSALARDGRITARPRRGVATTPQGHNVLEFDGGRNAVLILPARSWQGPVPLLVALHGATQTPNDMLGYVGAQVEAAGVAVVAPKSSDTTWDAIGGSFGEDVVYLNRVLEKVFGMVAIDPARLAIGGFSDGASYALSLGMINGDLFQSVVGFSPGFLIKGTPHGRPRIFISHGTHDHILPIDRCGRRISANLVSVGYDVTFREFDGDHEIPFEIALEGFKWIASN